MATAKYLNSSGQWTTIAFKTNVVELPHIECVNVEVMGAYRLVLSNFIPFVTTDAVEVCVEFPINIVLQNGAYLSPIRFNAHNMRTLLFASAKVTMTPVHVTNLLVDMTNQYTSSVSKEPSSNIS